MQIHRQHNWSRRHFLKVATGCSIATLAGPSGVFANKSGSETILGSGDYKYRVIHDWAKLPDSFTWQTTHNVAVDKAGNLYVIHEGRAEQKDHPAIFVFDSKGKYIRSFGKQFQGGGHGLEVREEGGQEFLYVTAYQHLKFISKLDLNGEVVFEMRAPMESGKYAQGEDTHPERVWGRDRFMPTNFAFHPDGGFYLADGYGAYCIHRYDANGKWLSSFGTPGKDDGQFQLPHGLWIDDRPGREPSVVVADRVNARLQWFSLDGKHLETMGGFLLPANVDVHEDLMLVPDLKSRVTLLNSKNEVIAHLGEDPDWTKAMEQSKGQMRNHPENWQAGRFVHPHDACFAANGDIYVAEWVATGRITKLERV